MGLLNKLFGTYSERELKKIYPIADAVDYKVELEFGNMPKTGFSLA